MAPCGFKGLVHKSVGACSTVRVREALWILYISLERYLEYLHEGMMKRGLDRRVTLSDRIVNVVIVCER